MLTVATWLRPKDEPFFQRSFAAFPQVQLANAMAAPISLAEAEGLLLTGGPDISAEFLRQEVHDPSAIDNDVDPARDAWEFAAIKTALDRQLPIFGICKGLQVLNVALGGTLRLDIPGHDALEMRFDEVQPLRNDRAATHRFELVNSSHHQAIDRLADGFRVEAWCEKDEIIEQIRLTSHPFVFAAQYHPERSEYYAPLFADFVARLNGSK